ncbi:MAG: hypothetical protein IT541_00025 [Hyphomicrobiales bacterium]|jgi:hypothetical protein|nr:hypothetical protein [Hyphomicrobiales bacterium]MBP9175363.1 hypothetical protein [Hyphomicrobiales bacterium]MBZ0261194.1 hypothetical protein [Hyphomicrobiales bacterium]MCC7479891.1 hypothetical protein [Hyphomicrobiales bacterium]
MRSEILARDEIAVFTLTCPGNDCADARVHEIQLRGNLPLLIGSDVLAEISHADLLESWETAISLPLKDLNAMTTLAGKRLSEMLEEHIDAEDMTDLVSDAAVLFLLAMRRFGVSEANRIPACTVKWNGQEATESVQMLA